MITFMPRSKKKERKKRKERKVLRYNLKSKANQKNKAKQMKKRLGSKFPASPPILADYSYNLLCGQHYELS